jgi:DMSO/TMAO reductase YedYZ molybdopterin-dependent catalytic subunit
MHGVYRFPEEEMIRRFYPYDLLGIAAIIILSALIAGCIGNGTGAPSQTSDPAFRDWHLTLNGTREKVLTLEDLRALPAVTGHGYAVSTTGIRFGPYVCRGVDLRELVSLTGGMGQNDSVWVSAPDGYLWVFDAEQLEGRGFITMNESLREIPSPPLRIILMYEQDGKPLTYDEGGPARIAIVSEEEGIVTEGSAWVKWVDRIEIHRK